jgi:general secretion pathway protein D
MKKILIILVVSFALWSCATLSPSYKSGTKAALNKDWDQAVEYFERAVLENPKKSYYRAALLRAKVNASLVHVARARNLSAQGKKEEALAEYKTALSFDPTNFRIIDEARTMAGEKPRVEEPVASKIEPLIKLQVSRDPIDLKFTETNLRSIFLALGKYAGVNIIFDELFKDTPFAIDLEGMNFEEALNALCMASKSFYRSFNEKTVIIIPDRPDKRMQYELNVIKTFYLSNINAQDVQSSLLQLLRTQFKGPTVFVDKELNSVTIRDVPSVLELAEKVLYVWDKPKAEVMLNIEIMEVSRTKMRQLGLDFESLSIGIKNISGLGVESIWRNLSDLNFSKAENYQISLPASLLQFLESDSDTKLIAQSQVRGIHGEEIKYLVGDEVPIPSTTFSPIAAGGVSQQPITSFEFKDVGIDITIVPRIHRENDVTLELDLKVKSIGGTGYADIPIISTREVKNVFRLKNGETNLLVGLLKDEERKTLKGVAFLKNLPGIGALFSSDDTTIQQTDVIMTITPHIIRNIPLSERDREPIWVDLQGTMSSSPSSGRISPAELEAQQINRRLSRQQEQRAAGVNRITLSPANFEIPQNREFRISLNMRTEEEIGSFSMGISYDPQVLEVKEIVPGAIITRGGENIPFLKNIDNSSGMCTIGFSSPHVSKGIKGSGRIATLVFLSKAKGECSIAAANVTGNAVSGKSISFTAGESRVRVK